MPSIMAGTVFEIEGVLLIDGRGYLLAPVLDPDARFAPFSNSTLDGYSVEQWLDVPRALDVKGAQRHDLFAFCLKSAADIRHFRIGLRVALI